MYRSALMAPVQNVSISLALKYPNTIRDVRRSLSSLKQRRRFPGFPKRISNQATGFSCLFSMRSELKPRRQQQCFWISFIWFFFCLIVLICICTCRDEQGSMAAGFKSVPEPMQGSALQNHVCFYCSAA